jgi:hypothetical protein
MGNVPERKVWKDSRNGTSLRETVSDVYEWGGQVMFSRIGRKIGGILFAISFIYLIGMAGADDVAGGPVSSIFAKGLIAVAGMAVGAVLIAAGGEQNEDTL